MLERQRHDDMGVWLAFRCPGIMDIATRGLGTLIMNKNGTPYTLLTLHELILIDQRGTVAPCLGWLLKIECATRVRTREPKAMSSFPIIDLVKCVPPAYRIAYPVCACSYPRPIQVVK